MPAFAIVDNHRVYQHVFDIYMIVGLTVLVVFMSAIIGFALWFRRHPGGRASSWHEANPLEISYAVVLTLIAAFLLYVTYSAEHQIDVVSMHEHPALTIDVTGARWEWTYTYPRYGITRQSGEVGDQPLVVPIDEPIRFRLRSDDVIHSFWIPAVDFKRDAIPGIVQTFVLEFDRAGTSSGSCAEYCGIFHSEMVFTVHALKPAAFRRWATSQARHPAAVGVSS